MVIKGLIIISIEMFVGLVFGLDKEMSAMIVG